MRKTQVALAALALMASTAALAEVTIYGTLDAAITHTNNGKGTAFDGTGSWTAPSHLGLKGGEDLGGGLKANWQLETGVTLNNGAAVSGGFGGTSAVGNRGTTGIGNAGALFTRVATVGLSGDFGSLTFGQQLSPFIVTNAVGTAGNGAFFVNRMLMVGFGGAAVNVGGLPSNFPYDGFFVPNAIQYATPSIAGWTVNFLTTTKGGANDGVQSLQVSTDQYTATTVSGAIGPIALNLGYQNRKNVNSSYSISASSAVTSDLTIYGNYLSNDESKSAGSGISTGRKIGSTSVSAAYKVSPALTANLQYARNDDTIEQTLTSVGAQYSLSKQTSLYASYGKGTGGVNAAFADRANNRYHSAVQGLGAASGAIGTRDSTNVAIGVIHSF
jgi:predicted porin